MNWFNSQANKAIDSKLLDKIIQRNKKCFKVVKKRKNNFNILNRIFKKKKRKTNNYKNNLKGQDQNKTRQIIRSKNRLIIFKLKTNN